MPLSRNWLKIIFFVPFFLSPWFMGFPLLIKILIMVTSVVLCFYPKKYLIYFSLIILAIAQISTTRLKTVFEFSGFDVYLHLQHQNEYPPSLYRAGNIIENKIMPPLANRFLQNFFDCFDFLDYFKNLLFPVLFFPFIYGLFIFCRKPDKIILFSLVLSILFLTFIGPKGNFGQFLLFPFLVFFTTHGFFKN